MTTATRPPAVNANPVPSGASTGVPTATRGAWRGRDLLALQGLPVAELRELLLATREYAATATRPETRPPSGSGELAGKTIATLFFEDSTRTKTSFTLAATRLGADVIDLAIGASSVNKGETLVDTALNVEAMGVSGMIVRARQSGAAELIASAVACPVLNAGDGRHEHPTQGLLDAYTLAEAHGRLDTFDLSGLTVAIVGDLGSSRVCRSNIAAMTALGARVHCVGPVNLAPAALRTLAARPELCTIHHELDPLVPELDAIMMLRVQFERHGDDKPADGAPKPSPAIPSLREFREIFGLTVERAARLKPGCIVMHPGPMNRGLEIDSEVADSPRSVILHQVSRGVAARMAALALCVGGR